LRRPLLPYPDFCFAGVPATPALLQTLTDHIHAARTQRHGLGVPDPDVTHVHINVQVLTAQGPFVELFSVLKALPKRDGFASTSPHFDNDETALALRLVYSDCANVFAQAQALKQASQGRLLSLPAGRPLRLRLRAACMLGAAPDTHFGPALVHSVDGQRVALGLVADIDLHQAESAPSKPGHNAARQGLPCALFEDGPDWPHSLAWWMPARRDTADPPPTAVAQKDQVGQTAHTAQTTQTAQRAQAAQLAPLAQALGLCATDMGLQGPVGQRVVFAATGNLPHRLNAASSEIVFTSPNALLGRWIVVRRVRVNRDGCWDGLLQNGLTFEAVMGEPADPQAAGAVRQPPFTTLHTLPALPTPPTCTLAHVPLPFAVDPRAGPGTAAREAHTTFILLDALEAADSHDGDTPANITLVWRVRAQLATAEGPCDWLGPERRLQLPATHANVRFFTQAVF
jgi:hypothetical protein